DTFYSFMLHYTSNMLGLDLKKLYYKNKIKFYDFHLDHDSLKKPNTQKLVSEYLVEHLLPLKSDIIMAKHNLRQRFFPEEIPPIPYANYILKDIKKAKSKLGKYIAVHWRMENVDAASLPICADDLIMVLR